MSRAWLLSLWCLTACPAPPVVREPSPRLYAEPPRALVVASGLVECFPENTESAPGQRATCELSSVIRAGETLYFANDKNFFGKAPLFTAPSAGPLGALTQAESPALAGARKLEALTTTPDGAWVIASTAFDRAKADASWNAYNTVLFWPAGEPAKATIAARDEKEGVVSSLPLRAVFSAALRSEAFPEGPPYFKIEGLAALPDGRLLVGIREAGARFDDFSYQLSLLSLSYRVETGALQLGEKAERIWSFTPPVGLIGPLGLSGIEYDAARKRLWILTSYESPSGRGAYLWSLSLEDLAANRPPVLVRDAQGGALFFPHKAEGIALLPGGDLLLICDDDTATSAARQVNQAPYLRLQISELASGAQGR
jgi:hypothetical protein